MSDLNLEIKDIMMKASSWKESSELIFISFCDLMTFSIEAWSFFLTIPVISQLFFLTA